MALAMRANNGLHHAISLGNIEVSSKLEKCYDSDDENMSRHRLRTSSSSELYPRTSIYSKGDIREQYCLTDRQLSTIERPRRERFFGCLSGRNAPQSFLGVCVGRRAPSDENLAAYAPFYKYPRYQHHYPQDSKAFDTDLESSYFRRQPASILSTAKIPESAAAIASGGNRYSWTESQAPITSNKENSMFANDQRVTCRLFPVQNLQPDTCFINPFNPEQQLSFRPTICVYGCATHGGLPPAPPPPGPSTPRTKHVSFARSHTLTSFDDVNLGLRSSVRIKTARSQERLIGGKKPIIATGSIYEPQVQVLQNPNQIPNQQVGVANTTHPSILHHPHIHGHGQHGHSHLHQHQHQHHHGPPPFHVHQILPIYHQEPDTRRTTTMVDSFTGMSFGGVGIACQPTNLVPPSPEIVVVEKKFRNAMKTQATQTELRKEGLAHSLELSPRTIHKVKVVSQGAQTNGLINGKKLTKSLSEMPSDKVAKDSELDRAINGQITLLGDHETLHRTQSEEPPRSPLQSFHLNNENQFTLMYYNPPPPLDVVSHQGAQTLVRRNSRIPSVESSHSYHPLDDTIPSVVKYENVNQTFPIYKESLMSYDDSCGVGGAFDYESNSLPRRACNYHRLDNDLYSNSLPRRETTHTTDICRHITDCTELLGDCTDYSRQHLLPPPRQYRRNDDDDGPVVAVEEEEEEEEEESLEKPTPPSAASRRMSMFVTMESTEDDTYFRRDDVRRQSMPITTKPERLIDGYVSRTLQRPKAVAKRFDSFEEKEIFIDFKPHVSPTLTTKKHHRHRKVQKSVSDGEMLIPTQLKQIDDDSVSNASLEIASTSNVESECDEEEECEEDEEKEDPVYENVPSSSYEQTKMDKKSQFRKRSISLEDASAKKDNAMIKSAPPSPCQDEMLANTSTYPSSDSLANDLTRDHSDGIWNESQVTVLTAETKESAEPATIGGGHIVNLLLTPSAKRKNLILQHQQRSSIDTDALDLEDQLTDYSPTYSILSSKTASTPTTTTIVVHQKGRETTSTLAVPISIITPTIAVTPIAAVSNTQHEVELHSPRKSPSGSRRSSKTLSPATQDIGKMELQFHQNFQQKNAEAPGAGYFRADSMKNNTNNTTDISECSTNTDEYITCTDTSKRTPGIKTPPTTTSSSSTTQVPVSAQSSQTEKSHGGSSFESASSLYSTRCDVLSEDMSHFEEKLLKTKNDAGFTLTEPISHVSKRSPSHSISSTSSGSFNLGGAGMQIKSPYAQTNDILEPQSATAKQHVTTIETTTKVPSSTLEREKPKKKTESVSDDERSEMRYSSSGYYESPHDDELNIGKMRRHRLEEDRKRRRTSMKLDIEKENLRALTSPIKKSQILATTAPLKDKSPDKPLSANIFETTSPTKMKRFRPKIRRQLRRSSRDESTPPRRQKNLVTLYGIPAPVQSEKLLDCSLVEKVCELPPPQPPAAAPAEVDTTKPVACAGHVISPKANAANSTTSATEPAATTTAGHQLKAKSIESLRSVSPGSDSVFYSEADGTGADPHSHCLHCGKEMETSNPITGGVAAGDSVESLPCIENDNEQDIVKPPSDFADSPVTTKTTQRLYKKMDKRFRSEERYAAERGRHFKSRQENIRAKSEERGREKCTRSPQTLRPAGSSPCVLPDVNTEQKSQVIYRGHYDHSRYSRLTDADVWTQLDHQSFDRHRERRASTESEKSFHAKYQVILHRLVQRRCTLEMYHRQKNNIFKLISSNSSPDSIRRKLEEILKLMLIVWAREGQVLSKIAKDKKHGIDKTVVVKSDSGEFGFRIHGSKPVVVAAIEPDTPAESSGLEVGDIIISVNGVQVLDKHHTEVVKIAHAGCETLELEVARTIGVLLNEQQEKPGKPIFSGYLWRQSGQAKGTPNANKWVRRWFSLRPDHCLYYYKTEDDTQPVGAMIMVKHKVEQCPPEVGKPFAFKIDSGEGIPMYVAADSEELANQWMNILKHSAAQADPWLEKCARTLHQPPSEIVRPDCFGYLMKLGSRWCGWSKRYCVLKDACLYFYQDANSKNAFGMACLQGYKVASMSTNASGRKNSFEIIPQEPKLRHYYFSTESEMDKKRWISALEYSIDRWIKSG